MDSAGNLYGTTSGVDNNNQFGSIFEVSPPASAGMPWTEKSLWVLGGVNDGFGPPLGSLVPDKLGHLFGATSIGGANAHYGGPCSR
jgi:hypothetical protein